MPHRSRPPVAASSSSGSPALRRDLGPLDGAAIVVSNVIGSGIFIVPAFVTQAVPNAWAMLGVWLAGGVLAFAGAMAYAELAALRPRAGGEYVYLHEAFGPVAGFLTGWTSFVAGFSGAIAASAVGLASYLGRFVPAAADTTPLLQVPLGVATLTLSPQSVVALTAIAGLSVVHVVGLGPGRIVQNVLAALKVLVLMAFVALGFTIGMGTGANFAAAAGPVAPAGWALALIPVMFSYSGWDAAAYVAEEMRDPGRNVPLALGIGHEKSRSWLGGKQSAAGHASWPLPCQRRGPRSAGGRWCRPRRGKRLPAGLRRRCPPRTSLRRGRRLGGGLGC